MCVRTEYNYNAHSSSDTGRIRERIPSAMKMVIFVLRDGFTVTVGHINEEYDTLDEEQMGEDALKED